MFKNSTRPIWLFLLLCLILPPPTLMAQTDPLAVIDDFETTQFADYWWTYLDDGAIACGIEAPGADSDHALYMNFDVGPHGYVGCGRDILNARQWHASSGLQFDWWASSPGLSVTIIVTVRDLTQTNPDIEGRTPFEAYIETDTARTPNNSWTQVSIPWSNFRKSEWVAATGVNTLDVTQIISIIIQISDGQSGEIWLDNLQLVDVLDGQPVAQVIDYDKFSLWNNGTQLRGANIWQRVVVPEIDGQRFLGDGHVGPPYGQDDFYRMSSEGANYVNISGPGLFTETPPYVLDEAVQANLDNLLTMIANADMFAVISFRTGPGRSDFTFYDDNIEEWGDPDLVIEHVWTDQAAQDAWVDMWQYTAERYQDNHIVVGYDLMVEPNAPGRLLEIWEPADFYPEYTNTLYDWNQLYPRLVGAIRTVDTATPILVGAMGWSAVPWLPYLEPLDDPRIVYTVHQYEPFDGYTHQPYPAENTYPGQIDLNWDGQPDAFGRDWLNSYLTPIDEFQAQYGVPVALNEYGLVRWVPGAAEFMADEMALFEARGMNHAFWMFGPIWPPHARGNDAFDYWHGTDPDNHHNIETSELLKVIRANWALNNIRPSDFTQ